MFPSLRSGEAQIRSRPLLPTHSGHRRTDRSLHLAPPRVNTGERDSSWLTDPGAGDVGHRPALQIGAMLRAARADRARVAGALAARSSMKPEPATAPTCRTPN